ncbi:hypothetical protein SHJG_3438 [Streptomyces hygroscopicus subsp. jinggangensis 5008]|nr:hypothetical protein SHJG_3438 [Streptomyces hygroscopicus subsp. jinggangensis 5008]AGF62869.1 hypothetical protein SHJGH_3203 [Streptomyces hygroscopicus subsp. jinggangensis TL01]
MAEVGAVQAARRPVLQHQQRQRTAPATGTPLALQRLDDDKPTGGVGSRGKRHTRYFPRPRPRLPRPPTPFPVRQFPAPSLLLCHRLYFPARSPLSSSLRPNYPSWERKLNTDTRLRRRTGRSISSTTATARSAYDSHGSGPSPGSRFPRCGTAPSGHRRAPGARRASASPGRRGRPRAPAAGAGRPCAPARTAGFPSGTRPGRPSPAACPRRAGSPPGSTATSRPTPATASPSSSASAALTKNPWSSVSSPCSGPLNGETACTAPV